MADATGNFKISITADATSAVAAAGQTSQALQATSQASSKAALDSIKDDQRQVASKAEFKSAIKGLAFEFPILAQVAHLAMNPITLAVSGIASAWAIWNARVKDCTEALGAFETPDLSEAKVGQVTAMADGYLKFAEALRQAVEQYKSVDASSKRAIENIDKEADRNKKLLESRKNLALAELDRDKASMAPGQYEKRKAEIEDAYEIAGVRGDQDTKRKKLDEKVKKERALAQSAQAKLDQAAGIKVGTAEQDAQTEADLKAQADDAKEAQKQARARRYEYAAYQAGEGNIASRIATGAKMVSRFGLGATSKEAIAQEDENIAYAQTPIDAYNARLRENSNRSSARRRRGELIQQAGQEAGSAEVIQRELTDKGGDIDQFNMDLKNDASVMRNNSLAKANKASGQVNDQAQQVSEEITKAVESGSKILESTMKKLAELNEAQARADERIKSLEGTRKNNPPST